MAVSYDPKAAARARTGPVRVPPVDRWLLLQLVASNALSVVWCVREHWPLIMLLVPYWIQSVVIGWYYRKRILALQRFSTAGFSMNDQPLAETPATQRETAAFLAMHFGFFHLIYAIFLCVFAAVGTLGSMSGLDSGDLLAGLALGAVFAATQRSEYRRNVIVDRNLRPNIGAMMFLPYLRVVPMHVMIILGSMLGGGPVALIVFGVLKTAADVGMQILGQRLVARSSAP